MFKRFTLFSLAILLMVQFSVSAAGQTLTTLGNASAVLDGSVLTVSTGAMSRSWQWTGFGLLTTSIKDITTNTEWASKASFKSDWNLPGAIDDNTEGILKGIEACVSDDDGLINKHIEVVATIAYPTANLELHNNEASKTLNLKFLAGKTIKLTDAKSGKTTKCKVGVDGQVKFAIENQADYRLFVYEII